MYNVKFNPRKKNLWPDKQGRKYEREWKLKNKKASPGFVVLLVNILFFSKISQVITIYPAFLIMNSISRKEFYLAEQFVLQKESICVNNTL